MGAAWRRGNFGIVTRFDFATVPMPQAVLAGMLAFPMEDGARILRAYRDWAAESPDSLTTIVALRTVLPLPVCPPRRTGVGMVGIGVCSVGDPADDEALLAPLRAMGTPLYRLHRAQALHRSPVDVRRQRAAAERLLLEVPLPGRALTDETIEAAVEQHLRAPQPWSYSLIGQLGGAIAQVANDVTAYPHREAPFIININGVDDDRGTRRRGHRLDA